METLNRRQADRPNDGRALTMRDRARSAIQQANADLAAGQIDDAAWYQAVSAEIATAYLAFDDPIWQSGYDGDEHQWRVAREIVIDAIDRDGTFLDIGCANGLLMESVARWAAERGHVIEPYGLDISSELAARARLRLPQWSDRIHVGNVIDWEPPRRFDIVRAGVEYVPPAWLAHLIIRLLHRFLVADGRLIIGPFRRGNGDVDPSTALTCAGLRATGEAESPSDDGTRPRRIVWIDASDRIQTRFRQWDRGEAN